MAWEPAGPRVRELDLLSRSVPVPARHSPALGLGARRFSAAPVPAAGRGSRVWAASRFILSADGQLRVTSPPTAKVPAPLTQACSQGGLGGAAFRKDPARIALSLLWTPTRGHRVAWEGRDSNARYVRVCNIPSRTFHLLRTHYFTYLSKSGLFLVLWAFWLILLSTSLPSVPSRLHPLSSPVTLSFFYQLLP